MDGIRGYAYLAGTFTTLIALDTIAAHFSSQDTVMALKLINAVPYAAASSLMIGY